MLRGGRLMLGCAEKGSRESSLHCYVGFYDYEVTITSSNLARDKKSIDQFVFASVCLAVYAIAYQVGANRSTVDNSVYGQAHAHVLLSNNFNLRVRRTRTSLSNQIFVALTTCFYMCACVAISVCIG